MSYIMIILIAQIRKKKIIELKISVRNFIICVCPLLLCTCMHIMLVLFLCILGSGHRIVSDSYKWIEVMNKKKCWVNV